MRRLVLPSQFLASRPVLAIARDTNGIVLTWSDNDAGLEFSGALNGSWISLPGGVSPYAVGATNTSGFYRVRR